MNKKTVLVLLVLVFLAALIPSISVARGIKPVLEDPIEAPLNPNFIEYNNNPPEVNYGYIPPPFDLSHLKNIVTKNINPAQALPTRFDWRELNGVTSVKNQNPCGTCWIFGTISVLESKALINEGLTYDFSEQSVALSTDRSWVYLYDGSDDPCHAGGWSWLAAETFIRKGAKLESCIPYNPANLSCDGSCLEDSCPGIKRVNGYRLVTNDGSQIDLIKQAIYNNGPVTGVFYYSGTYLYNDPTFGYFYDCPTTSSTNHLISIVGWDDNVPHMNTPGTGAWIVKNSWGTSWGNDGYFYLAYDSSNLEEISYLLYESYNLNQTLYSWDESTMNSSSGYNDNDAWMASVYTSQIAGQLEKVEFWVPSPNAFYQLFIYEGNFGSTLLAQKSGTLQEMGYYSISLSTPVNLSQGQAFTVMVKLNTPGYKYPIPIEHVDSFAQPPIQSGVTFTRNNDGDGWWDTSNNGWNVCLRAVVEASSTLPAVQVSSMNGGETLYRGQTVNITWYEFNLTEGNIKIQFFDGDSWSDVITGLPLNQKVYTWTVPDVISSDCKIKVVNYSGQTEIVSDESDNPFTIEEPPLLDHFEFNSISNQTQNVPFNITITAKDQYSNTYTDFNSSVTLSVNKGTITPTTTTNFVNGVLSNFPVTIPDVNTGVTITALASEKSGTSNSFDVNPGAYTLSISIVGSGSVIKSPDQSSYIAGTEVTLTANPSTSDHFVSWSGDVTGITNPLTITMDKDKIITATFEINPYTITATAGTGGKIEPSGNVVVNYGADQTFTITPNTGYHILDVKVDGSSIGAVSTYTFTNVTAAHTIEASFSIDTNTITASAGFGGAISPLGTITVNYGGNKSFTIKANPGFMIFRSLVDGSQITISNPFMITYTFSNVTSNHIIQAEFMKIPDITPPTITYISGIDINVPSEVKTNKDTYTFTVEVFDESGIGRMVVKVNGVVQIDKNNLDPTIYLSEGVNTVEVTVYDTCGNYTTKSFKVIKDSRPPVVNLTIPEKVISSTIEVKGIIYDELSEVKSVLINGTLYNLPPSGNVSLTLNLRGGVNIITVEATDNLENATKKTYNVTYTPVSATSIIIALQIDNPEITINGISKKIDAQGSKPIIKNGRTLLPIRVLIESLGGIVEWNAKEQKVTITLNGHSIILWIGKDIVLVNGSKVKLDVAPMIINGRTYLPLRFISENLGASVDWDETTKTVTIYYWP